jgi:hypothetical protein
LKFFPPTLRCEQRAAGMSEANRPLVYYGR